MAEIKRKAGAPLGNRNSAGPRFWSDAVKKAIKRNGNLTKLAEKLVAMANDGDLGAMRELGDRSEGKAVNQINIDANLDVSVVEVKR